MEQCGSCGHILALHAGAEGKCRLNGCWCLAFALPPEPVPAAAGPTAAVEAPLPAVSVEAFTAIITGAAFVVGLVIGLAAGIWL